MRTISSVLSCLAAAAAIAAPAWSANYSVDQTIGAFGSVTGTIDTDGTTGTLSAGNFTAWNLLVQGDGASTTLTNLNSAVYVAGSAITATSTDISFDFSSAVSSYLLFQAGGFGSGNTYWCNASTTGACFQGATATPESYFSPSLQTEPRSGNQVIATSAAGLVPEPATWAMFIGGVGLVGGTMRRRRRATVGFA